MPLRLECTDREAKYFLMHEEAIRYYVNLTTLSPAHFYYSSLTLLQTTLFSNTG